MMTAKTENKSLESSNNHFKEANNELSKTNQLMFKDLKKFQAELDKYNDVNYCVKGWKLIVQKAQWGFNVIQKSDFAKSSNAYTQQINDLNQTISDMKKELCAHQETISIMSQAKEAQIKLYKTREDFRKQSQGCYNDNLALMLAPDSDETIRLDKERRSKLSDLIRPFDYDQLNNLYDFRILWIDKPIAVLLVYRNQPDVKQTVATSHSSEMSSIHRFKDGLLSKGFITSKGLNHNLFSVGQFCDADLEVAFRKSTCYIRDLKGNDLLTGSRGTDLYSISLQDSTSPNPICLMAKATSSQACWRKAKRKSFHTKTTPSSKRRLQLLHMDLCGPMRVESINGKKYVLVIVDDYSRYTWTHFLRSKDETPGVLIDFLTLVQRGLHAQVTTVRTDKGTEFLNKSLHAYFAKEGWTRNVNF
ncbi:retrovirus-related pol polyprotein from transposon TNT 1-94 [Tanacetum coccineum]|uniref:Retrovirus-related pol polyprotein from transposon TNT 1-94 n=1 Tax=Tanacetum coccineum TaxID=301880 RepID=A0ABQ5E0M3_9ASTR